MTDFLKMYNLPDPVCLYKWTWSTIHLYLGTTSSCHRCSFDKLSIDDYGNFHNTPKKLSDRQFMLSGNWPTGGCEYCRKLEDTGGVSDRLDINQWGKERFVPPETKTNSKQVNLTPTMVEVYFNNTCNMSCIYCNSMFSSVWESEDKKYGLNEYNTRHLEQSRKNYPALLEAHWKWMKENAKNLKRYHILGGEPFFQQELEQNINFFLENPCPDLSVAIFSNLKVDNLKLKGILDKIYYLIKNNHVNNFSIICSLDAWGPQIEYVRSGLNLKKWEENFTTILNNYPLIGLSIHSTLTSLCMPTYPDLCKKISEWHKVRLIDQSASFVDNKPHLHVDAFPVGFFAKEFEAAREYTPINELKTKLVGMEKRVDSVKESKDNIKLLKEFLTDLDKKRGTNWKPLWPWLDQYEV